jgi:hypothetical protein
VASPFAESPGLPRRATSTGSINCSLNKKEGGRTWKESGADQIRSCRSCQNRADLRGERNARSTEAERDDKRGTDTTGSCPILRSSQSKHRELDAKHVCAHVAVGCAGWNSIDDTYGFCTVQQPHGEYL